MPRSNETGSPPEGQQTVARSVDPPARLAGRNVRKPIRHFASLFNYVDWSIIQE